MKKIVAVSLFLLFGGVVFAQQKNEVEVPGMVIESFRCMYPEIRNITWKFDDTHYSASFKLDGTAMTLLFEQNGSIAEIKNEIKLFELPLDINQLLTKDYSGWRIGKASHIDSHGTGYYETVVEKEEKTIVLVFNRHGGLLMKVLL